MSLANLVSLANLGELNSQRAELLDYTNSLVGEICEANTKFYRDLVALAMPGAGTISRTPRALMPHLGN